MFLPPLDSSGSREASLDDSPGGLKYADGSLPVGLGAGEASLGRTSRRVRNDYIAELKYGNGSAAVGLGTCETSFERKGRSCLELSSEEDDSIKTDWRRFCTSSWFLYS